MNCDALDESPAEHFRYVHCPAFPSLLAQLGASLWVTTYQAGKLIVVRSDGARLSTLLRTFDRAMGLAVAWPAGQFAGGWTAATGRHQWRPGGV